jgi:hypothetical protein
LPHSQLRLFSSARHGDYRDSAFCAAKQARVGLGFAESKRVFVIRASRSYIERVRGGLNLLPIPEGLLMTITEFANRSRVSRATRHLLICPIALIATAARINECNAQLCSQLTGGIHTEDFNTLAASGTSNFSVPTGFAFSEAGSGSNLTYAASDGSNSTGNTYSFGTTASTERAFGEITSTVVQPTIGACFVNSTNQPISSLNIGYTGEEWRLGAADGLVDRLDFQISTDAASLLTGTWTNINSLDFNTPNNVGAGAKDGNAAENRTVFAPVTIIPPTTIQPNDTFFIRWVPLNLSGANDGLAIDDFMIAIPEPASFLLLVVGLMATISCRPHKGGWPAVA